MKLQRILQAVHAQPWLITARAHDAIKALLDTHLAATFEAKAPSAARPATDFFGNALPVMTVDRGIATIPVRGVIGKGFSSFEKSCGAVGVEDIGEDVQAAVEMPSVKGIFLDVSSPGGMVTGTPEVAAIIAEARASKPVMAFTDEEMCSAAYWLASGASAIYAAPSADVGSIGVYMPWVDRTKMAENMGLKVDLIKNTEGTFKGAGYPGTALTAEQRQNLQEHVDGIFGMFKGAILASRPGVPDSAMRGQTFMGHGAVEAGLVDSVSDRAQAMADLRRLAGV